MTTFRTHAVRLALLGAVAGAGLMASAGSSEAVVYRKTVGYPEGRVARPTGAGGGACLWVGPPSPPSGLTSRLRGALSAACAGRLTRGGGRRRGSACNRAEPYRTEIKR